MLGKNIRKFLKVGVCSVFASMVLGLSVGPAMAEKVLRVAAHASLKNLDPIWTTAYITRNHGYMVYDTLIAMDSNLKPQPQMLEGWEISDDSMTYTFTLREGLAWHDGAPVTSADCIASIQRWGKRDGMGQKLAKFTESWTANNDKTFTLKLNEPYGLVLDSLGKISSNVPFMMPERLAKTDAFEAVPEQIGSGPFVFDTDGYIPGVKVTYRKNTNYKPRSEPASYAAGGKVVHFDTVEWLYIPDPGTTMNALIAGEIDFWETPSPDLVPGMEGNPDITIKVIDPLGTQGWLRPNHLNPPFDNPKARQALLHMVKQEHYLQAIIGDEKFWRACGAYFMCDTPLDSDVGAGPLMNQDLEMARKLLKEGGYNGETLILMDPTDIPVLHGASLVTAQMLRKIGAKVEVQAMDWSTLTSRRAETKSIADGGWNIFHTYSTGADVASPIANIGVSGGCVEEAWFGWPCDKMLEDLRDQFSRESDPAKQVEIGIALQKRAYEVVPYVNYGQWFQPTAYRTSLKGVLISPVPFFWNIEK